MAFAEANRAVVRYIAESVWGTTPGSGVVRTVRMNNSSITGTKETQVSEELRADRMVPGIVEVGAGTEGSMDSELSIFSHDDFFEQFLLGAWSLPNGKMYGLVVKGSAVSVSTINQIKLAGKDYTKYLEDNQYVKLEGFKTVANNGYFRINGVPTFSGGDTLIAVDETLVVETGSVYTKFLDASDVIHKSTLTAITAGNTINGGGANAFAGQTLKAGQKIYMEGLGKETGTLTATVADPTEGDTFVVSDGTDSITFEIRTDSTLVAAGNVHVAFSATEATLATNIAAAIMDQFKQEKFRVSATAAAAVVTLTNGRGTGGSITESSTGLTVANFSGGDAKKFGFKTISSLPNDDTIVTTEELTADANTGALQVIIKGSHIRNPGTVADITKKQISAETSYTDVDKNMSHNGLRLGTLDMGVSVGEICSVSFGFQGRETKPLSAGTVLGASPYTVLDAPATEPLNATANVGTISRDGVALASITSLELSCDAALRSQRVVGKKFPTGIGYGRLSITGSFQAYFENFDLYNVFRNHNTVALAWDFEDADHNRLFFRLPAVKFSANPVAPSEGIDTDVMDPVEWTAQRDPVLNTMMLLDRFSSVYPAPSQA